MTREGGDDLEALVATARAAIHGTEPDGVTAFRGKARVDLFAEVSPPLRTVLAAFVLWSLVFLRASMGAPILDPYGLVLRVVALGATLRAFLAIRRVAIRLPEILAAEKNALVLAPAGLVVHSRGKFRAIPRERVIGVHPGSSSEPPTLLLAPEAGEALVPLPPGLEDPRGRIAEALEAFVSDRGPAEPPSLPPPGRLATELYDRAAAGAGEPGTAVVPRGRGWLAQGPYGALLVAIALVERIARLPAGATIGPLAYGVLALSVALPLAWLVPRLVRARAAKGLAAVLSPEEILVRLPAGMARTPWQKVSEVQIGRRTTWSTLGGYRRLRTVHVLREHGASIELSEEILGVDPEALASLMDLYRRGCVPR